LRDQSRRAVPVHGYAEVLAASPQRFPEGIVHALEPLLGKRRFGQHDDATMTILHRPFHFAHHNVDITHIWNDRQRDVAVAYFTPFGHGVVMRSHAGKLKCGVGLEKAKIGYGGVRLQQLTVYTIVVKGFQALAGVVNDLRHFLPGLWEMAALDPAFHPRRTIAHPFTARPAIDHPALGAPPVFLDLDDLRNALAPLFARHPLRPCVAVKLRMGVTTK